MSPPLELVRRALERRYGLALDGLSEQQIAAALAAASRDVDCGDAEDPRFLASVVDRLPIDESWLFRDDGLWTWLLEHAGPALLERATALGRPVRALSIGCSSGQEPFSLAILFQGLLERAALPPSRASAFVEISGVDPSPARVAQAREGTVGAWSVQRCRPDWLRGRIVPGEAGDGRMRVDASVAAMCRFDVGNVLDLAARGSAALGGYDLVLCRHVLIYFRPDEAARIVAALGAALDPGALLVVSAAEAHLLSSASALEPAGALGAARAHPSATAAAARRAEASRRRARRRRPTPVPPPAARAQPREHRVAEDHVRRALEHAAAGRTSDALREARAASFLDPKHLLSRLVLGRALLQHDRERAREVLRDLLACAAVLPQEAGVPSAPGLSVGQVASAARLLLRLPEGA
jgi:chemotaxis methyl-accepting protein methylase